VSVYVGFFFGFLVMGSFCFIEGYKKKIFFLIKILKNCFLLKKN
jgi:hypothetical protein